MVKQRKRPKDVDPEGEANVTRMVITPTMAAAWIGKNTLNRPVRRAVVSKYAEDMISGRWRLNGATVVMAATGTIIDGQHRLLACIQAAVDFESYVASGIDEESFVTIDSGSSRKFSDVVHILGYPDASRLSAITRAWWEYQQRGKLGSAGREQPPTIQQLRDTLLTNSDIFLGCLKATREIQRLFGGGTAAWGVAYIALGLIDETDRDFFFDRLQDGQNLKDGEVIFAFRRLLHKDESRGRSLSSNLLLMHLFKAWNKFRQQESVMVLVVHAADGMPIPI